MIDFALDSTFEPSSYRAKNDSIAALNARNFPGTGSMVGSMAYLYLTDAYNQVLESINRMPDLA